MMKHKVEAAHEEPVAREKCCHYWIIESPDGPTSNGVCKLCGAEKEFRNSFPDSFWEGNVSGMFSEVTGSRGIESDKGRDGS